jgi:hypothetical protein
MFNNWIGPRDTQPNVDSSSPTTQPFGRRASHYGGISLHAYVQTNDHGGGKLFLPHGNPPSDQYRYRTVTATSSSTSSQQPDRSTHYHSLLRPRHGAIRPAHRPAGLITATARHLSRGICQTRKGDSCDTTGPGALPLEGKPNVSKNCAEQYQTQNACYKGLGLDKKKGVLT